MAKTGILHHLGTFLLFASAILLLITTICAPVINDLAILKVHTTDGGALNMGTFGYCQTSPNTADTCTGDHIGYNPAGTIESLDQTNFNRASVDSTKALTRVMILHPIATGLAFIAFLLALGAGVCGALLASLVSAVTFIITLVVMVCDFVLFGIIKRHVNRDGSGNHANYSVGMWTILAAMILLFFATFIVFFTCFSSRMHRKREARTSKHEGAYVDQGPGTPVAKRHFWQRRSRY